MAGLVCALVASLPMTGLAMAADEKPRAAVCLPLAVPVGATTRVVLRGWTLESVDEVRCDDPGVTVRVVGRGEAPLPNAQDLARAGDRQLELEVTIPADRPAGEVQLTLATAGTVHDATCRLLVGSPFEAVPEQEPNDGFRAARAVQASQVIDGMIQADRDVDVFAVELAEPTRMRIELKARSQGSAVDGLVTLYDARGRRVEESDDLPGQADPCIERMLPAGRTLIVVQDATDRGGPAHAYRLLIGPAK